MVGGSSTTDAGPEWAFAAFNELDGAAGRAADGGARDPDRGPGRRPRASPARPGGVVAAAGTLTDFRPDAGGTSDYSIGMARVLVDAEKRCDLSLAIAQPGRARAARHAAGRRRRARHQQRHAPLRRARLRLPAPWSAAPGALRLGRLMPGPDGHAHASRSATARRSRPTGPLELTLAAPDDAALGDNVVRLPVVFSFCDLQLALAEQPPVLGTEGARRFSFTLRNVGTARVPRPRRSLTALTGRRARRVRRRSRSAPGRSVDDAFNVGVAARHQVRHARAALALQRAATPTTSAPANNGVLSAPMVVRPGDTNVRKPSRGRHVHAAAPRPGAAKGVSKRTLRVRGADLGAAHRQGVRVAGLGRAATCGRVDAGAGGKCDEPVWVTVAGTEQWRCGCARSCRRAATRCARVRCWPTACAEGTFGARRQEPGAVPRALTQLDGCTGSAQPARPSTRYVRAQCGRVLAVRCCAGRCSCSSRPSPRRGPLDDPADQWLPRSDGAAWVYAWSNSDLPAGAAQEKYTS